MIRTVDSGNLRLLKSLVEKASYSLDQVDSEGNNILHRAVIAERKDIVKYISRRCEYLATQWNVYGLAPVHLALASNSPGLVKALLWVFERDKSINLKTSDDLTLLQYTVKHSHPSILKFYLGSITGKRSRLVEKINERNHLGQTAVHLAAASGSREAVSILIENGGDLSCKDNEGMLPFHHALSNGFLFTATFIAKIMGIAPSDMINEDLNGSSCILKACLYSFDPMVIRSMIRWKADLSKTDSSGHDAFYYAKANKKISEEIIIILMEGIENSNSKSQ